MPQPGECNVGALESANTVFSPSKAGNMGIGLLGAANTLLLRKFRFLFGINYCIGQGAGKQVGASFVKTASRPDITIEETELNFLNETTWIPGKAKWETVTITYYDVAGNFNIGLLDWLASVYDFTSECRFQNSKPKDYAGEGHLVMLDGCGNPLQEWIMANAWPTAIKFGEVDYATSEYSEIELTMRYSNVKFKNFCGRQPQRCDCGPC